MVSKTEYVKEIQKIVYEEMKQLINMSLSRISELQKNENLSTDGLTNTHLLRSISSNMMKLVSFCENLNHQESGLDEKIMLNVSEFFTETIRAVSNMLAGYKNTQLKLNLKVSRNKFIYLNVTELEYTVNNLIFILIKHFTEECGKIIKISVDEDNEEKYLIVTLAAEGNPILNKNSCDFKTHSPLTSSMNFEEMNLWLINSKVDLQNGSFAVKRTRTYNKFIISLSLKIPDEVFSVQRELHKYIPDIFLIREIYSELFENDIN